MAATVSSSLPDKKSVDLAVQHTNDDSIVSKRSAARQGYYKDEYLRHYVKKAVRRTPLINRGYYLRLKAMTSLTEMCIAALSSNPSSSNASGNCSHSAADIVNSQSKAISDPYQHRVQVLSLGAGFDTLAARLYDNPEYQHVHFYEVDFPEVIRNKTCLSHMSSGGMNNFPYLLSEGNKEANDDLTNGKDPKIKDEFDESRGVQIDEGEMHFIRYHCIGFDLRQTCGKSTVHTAVYQKTAPAPIELKVPLDNGLAATLVRNGFDLEAPTIVYAECVMQYMPPEASTELIEWVANNIKNSMFLAYDQLNPDDSFGHRMQSSLSSKHSPLLGIHLYSDGWYLSERARKAGLTDVRFANFYDISSYFICDDEKNRVDKLEAFDEFEEWSEMCEHYGILYGRSPSYDSERYGVLGDVEVLKVIDKPIKKRVKKREEESGVVTSLCPHMFIGHHAWPSSRFSKEGFGNGGFHAEYIRLPGEHSSDGAGSSYQAVLVGFGGISTKKGTTRDDTLTVHAIGYSMGNLNVIETGTKPCARAYHSFTRVSPWKYVVFGGRTNPNDILSDTFLLELGIDEDTLTVVGKWSRLVCSSSDAPCARYRHLAVGCFGVKDVKRHSDSLHHCPAVLFIQGGRTLSDEDSMNANEINGCHIKDDLNQDKIKRKNTSIFTPNRLSDMWLGSVDTVSKTISWERPDVHCEPDHQLPPLCSASAVRLDGNTDESCCKVLITGGLLHDFYPSNSAWEVNITNCWGEMNVSNEKEDDGKQLKRATVTVNKMKWTLGKHGRFSHTMTLLPDQETILVLGGSGFVPKGNADNFPPYIISKGGVVKPVNLPDSLSKVTLTLHSVTLIHPFPHLTVGDDSSSQPVVLAVIGGGFMCFSFGQYTVTPFLLKLSTLSLTCAQEPVIFPSSNHINSNSNGDDNNDVTSVVYDSRHYSDTHLHKENKKSIIGLIPIKPRNPFPNKYTIDSYSAEAWHSTLVKSNNTSEPIILSGPLHPYLFRKVPVGKCVDSWNTENVRQHFESDDRGKTRIAVHVAKGSASLDFINKNFEFRHVTLAEMVQHCFPPTQVNHEGNHVDTMPAKTLKETWYFRSVGSNMKTEKSNFYKDFPLLADEFHLPEEIKDLVLNPAYHHQSCLRINEGGMQLWTHYDIMDNILVNITGRKRVVLFHPSQANNLYVPTGSSSSPIIDIDNLSPKLIRQYPNYIGAHHHHSTMEVVLGPGDMLVIPALWFHHITAIDPCISINIFYKRPSMCVPREGEEALVSSSLKGLGSGAVCCSDSRMTSATQQNDRNSLYDPKDLYGNKDLPSLVEIREHLLNIINKSSSASAHPCLSPPLEFRAFMLQQLANEVNALSQKLYLEASSSISETSNNVK